MNKNDTALILIDLQKESNFGLQNLDNVLANTNELVQNCRELDIPIIYTRQINRSDRVGLSIGEPLEKDGAPFYYNTKKGNHEILEEVAPMNNDIIIDKYRWSAFHETSFDLVLRSLGVKNLIVGGVVTDGCVMSTVYDAYFRDYNVHLVKDMCAASNEGAHMSSLLILANWVYNLEIYNTKHMIKKLQGKEYSNWKCEEADSLQFTPENMREMYKKLDPREDL